MSEPIVAQEYPYVMELEPGTYWWCACGKSSKQPFCNGSHTGTGFTPTEVTIEKTQQVALCGCKHTKNPPFCDGSHTKL